MERSFAKSPAEFFGISQLMHLKEVPIDEFSLKLLTAIKEKFEGIVWDLSKSDLQFKVDRFLVEQQVKLIAFKENFDKLVIDPNEERFASYLYGSNERNNKLILMKVCTGYENTFGENHNELVRTFRDLLLAEIDFCNLLADFYYRNPSFVEKVGVRPEIETAKFFSEEKKN